MSTFLHREQLLLRDFPDTDQLKYGRLAYSDPHVPEYIQRLDPDVFDTLGLVPRPDYTYRELYDGHKNARRHINNNRQRPRMYDVELAYHWLNSNPSHLWMAYRALQASYRSTWNPSLNVGDPAVFQANPGIAVATHPPGLSTILPAWNALPALPKAIGPQHTGLTVDHLRQWANYGHVVIGVHPVDDRYCVEATIDERKALRCKVLVPPKDLSGNRLPDWHGKVIVSWKRVRRLPPFDINGATEYDTACLLRGRVASHRSPPFP